MVEGGKFVTSSETAARAASSTLLSAKSSSLTPDVKNLQQRQREAPPQGQPSEPSTLVFAPQSSKVENSEEGGTDQMEISEERVDSASSLPSLPLGPTLVAVGRLAGEEVRGPPVKQTTNTTSSQSGFAGVALFGLGKATEEDARNPSVLLSKEDILLRAARRKVKSSDNDDDLDALPYIPGQERMKLSQVIFLRRKMLADRKKQLTEDLQVLARGLKNTKESSGEGCRKAISDLTTTLRRGLMDKAKLARPSTAR